MFGLGFVEIAIIAVIAIIFFGPSRLPQLGKGIGSAIANFKSAISGKERGEKEGFSYTSGNNTNLIKTGGKDEN